LRDRGLPRGSDGGPSPFTRPLSPREIEILDLLCLGLTAPQVASRLGLSRGSVKNKRRAIYQKLHVSDLAHACAATKDQTGPGPE
jgi:DNA-binding NarL/FixJ family response regulator